MVGLTLDGVLSDPGDMGAAPMRTAVEAGDPLHDVTFRENHAVCSDPCDVHEFFANAPNAALWTTS